MTKTIRYFTEQQDSNKDDQTKLPPRTKGKLHKQKNIVQEKKNVQPKVTLKRISNSDPKFPGRAPIPQELLEKHDRGEGLDKGGVRTRIHKKRQLDRDQAYEFARKQAARVEILLTEESGVLEADSGETTTQFRQGEIVNNVDITSAAKHFELHLRDFGPYRARYTRNGRHLALGGKLGHVAAFDWVTKKLHFEINVMETVHEICWLHIETMLAVAQKDWVYIYDNQGIELHCLKALDRVTQMEFLPYHFLLATTNDLGYLSWLDVSIGEIVVQYNSKLGRVDKMTQNPYNAVLCVGSSNGVVSMWAPNTRDPLAKMLCHNSAITALHIDPKGLYMATSGNDRTVKVWDIRNLKGPLQIYRVKSTANNVTFSQKQMLAVGMGNVVEVYRDCCITTAKRAYLRHRFNNAIANISFCPYEDVLGIGSEQGFTSLLVPGAGEANFDAFEANPYQTKSQRKEYEVKALLEKIPSDLISLDPTKISEVDVPSLREKVEATKKLLFVKPPKINYEPRRKGKGKGGSVKMSKNKKILQEQARKEFVQTAKSLKTHLLNQNESEATKKVKPKNVLDRFLPKQK